jgi:hypothetical protein
VQCSAVQCSAPQGQGTEETCGKAGEKEQAAVYMPGTGQQCSVVQCSAVLTAVQCSVVQCSAVLTAVQCGEVEEIQTRFSVECSGQCSAVQCSEVQCYDRDRGG